MQFEDEQTIRRQIQEMLHIEKIFDEDGIQSEIEAYAPLVPDGGNWKATMLIEYPDPHERKRELARLIGIEDRMFVEVEGHARIYAVADEDLDRENDEKTSSVHFLRFDFPPAAREAVRAGAAVKLGCDHTNYPAHVQIAAADAVEPGRRPALARAAGAHRLDRRVEAPGSEALVLGDHLRAEQQQRGGDLQAEQHRDRRRQRAVHHVHLRQGARSTTPGCGA